MQNARPHLLNLHTFVVVVSLPRPRYCENRPINHRRSPAFSWATLYIPAGDEVSPLSRLSYRPHARWISHLPFVQASHSWRPASLNISSLRVIYYRVRTRLACCCCRRRRRCSSSFIHVHQFTTRARHDDDGAPRVTVSRACTRVTTRTLSTHMHSHTYTPVYTRCFLVTARYICVSREPFLRNVSRLSKRATIISHLGNTLGWISC